MRSPRQAFGCCCYFFVCSAPLSARFEFTCCMKHVFGRAPLLLSYLEREKLSGAALAKIGQKSAGSFKSCKERLESAGLVFATHSFSIVLHCTTAQVEWTARGCSWMCSFRSLNLTHDRRQSEFGCLPVVFWPTLPSQLGHLRTFPESSEYDCPASGCILDAIPCSGLVFSGSWRPGSGSSDEGLPSRHPHLSGPAAYQPALSIKEDGILCFISYRSCTIVGCCCESKSQQMSDIARDEGGGKERSTRFT